MSSKDKLRKFRENEGFECLVQPSTDEVLFKDFGLKGRWNSNFFNNSNPIVLELGCGKGEYTIELAKRFPQKNFIGIDIKGARLWKGAKYATENNMPNVAFIRTRIDFIESLFAPGEIDEIWITFPDPQIKKARKRLTGSMFINHYNNIIGSNGAVNLKTDSRFLHEYTKALCNANNFKVELCDNDIYRNIIPQDPDSVLAIKTFYEAHYLKNGLAITYIRFIPGGKAATEPQWDEEYWEREEPKGRENVSINKGI